MVVVDDLRLSYNEFRRLVIVFEYELRQFLEESFKSVVCVNFILGDCTHNFLLQLKVVPFDDGFDIGSPIVKSVEERFGFICEEVCLYEDGVYYIQFIEREVFNG